MVKNRSFLILRVFGSILLQFIILTISISAYAQLEERRIDVFLLIDVSGSMKENDPEQYRKEAAKLFISLANPEDRIGIITFGNKGETVSNLVKLSTEEDKKRLLERIDKIKSEDEYTNITHGLNLAYRELRKRKDEVPKGILIMLTDGWLDIPKENEDKFGIKDLNVVIDDIRKRDWVIYTIGFEQADKNLLLEISGDKDKSFYIKNLSDLPLKYFEIMRYLKHESISAYEIVEHKKYPIKIPPGKEEVILYIKKKADSVLKNIFITDPKGNRYKLSEIGQVSSKIYQIVKIRGLEPGKWEIEIGSKYRLKDVISGLVLLMFISGVFLLYKFYRSFNLTGTLRIKEDKGRSPKVRKLAGREMFLDIDSKGISLKNKITGSSIARLCTTKDDDYRVNLEVLEKNGTIKVREGILTSRVRLVEEIEYHLESPEYSCILSYFENNPNPYTPRKPVSEEMFAVRKEVDEIVGNFKSSEPKIFLLWGLFCSGKTSIIQQVERKLQESHHCINIDITKVLSSKLKDEVFLGTLLSEICRQLPLNDKRYLNDMRNMDSPSLLKDRFLVEFNKIKEKRFLISIDESLYDLQKSSNDFSIQNLEEMIRFFKNLGNSSFCILISYSKNEPIFSPLSAQEEWNRVNNNCEFLQIGLLETHSAEKLISRIEENCPSLKIKKSVMDMIKNLSGGHPYFIQLLCFSVINYCNENKKDRLSKKDIERCMQRVLKTPMANLNFWLLWQNLTRFEKIFLSAVIELKRRNYPASKYEITNHLKEKKVKENEINQISQHFDLLQDKKGKEILYIPLYERWLRENISLDIGLEEFQKDE